MTDSHGNPNAHELEEAVRPLRERIIALEMLLEAHRKDSNERERLLNDKETIIQILRREIVEIKKNSRLDKERGYPKI